MKYKVLALVSLFAAMSANASVIYDENGVGFVGKGDIQSLFDWNNSQLQENASLLEFRFITAGSVTWQCEWFTGPTQKRMLTPLARMRLTRVQLLIQEKIAKV